MTDLVAGRGALRREPHGRPGTVGRGASHHAGRRGASLASSLRLLGHTVMCQLVVLPCTPFSSFCPALRALTFLSLHYTQPGAATAGGGLLTCLFQHNASMHGSYMISRCQRQRLHTQCSKHDMQRHGSLQQHKKRNMGSSEACLTCDDQGLIAGVGRVAVLRSARCWTLRRSVATVRAILNIRVKPMYEEPS